MPYAAPRPCSKHPSVLVTKDTPCPQCPTHGWKHTTTSAQRGYGYKWQKIRVRILKRDNYLCQVCKKNDKLSAAKAVDHIISKAQGGTDDDSNLQSICTQCHKDKTYQESRGST